MRSLSPLSIFAKVIANVVLHPIQRHNMHRPGGDWLLKCIKCRWIKSKNLSQDHQLLLLPLVASPWTEFACQLFSPPLQHIECRPEKSALFSNSLFQYFSLQSISKNALKNYRRISHAVRSAVCDFKRNPGQVQSAHLTAEESERVFTLQALISNTNKNKKYRRIWKLFCSDHVDSSHQTNFKIGSLGFLRKLQSPISTNFCQFDLCLFFGA